jgi:hypothetical protein
MLLIPYAWLYPCPIGLTEVQIPDSGEDYCRYCQAVSAPARIALSKETEERKEDIWRKVAEEAARNYGTANGLKWIMNLYVWLGRDHDSNTTFHTN